MTYRGQIRAGAVIFEKPVGLPDGTPVEVRAVEAHVGTSDDEGPTLYERLGDLIGAAEGLPVDMAENHDHYIHGTAKRGKA